MDELQQGQVTAEGATLSEALMNAAQSLGVEKDLVEHKIDMSHFRNSAGRSVGVSTVRIIAWAQDPSRFQPARAGREWLQGLVERMGLKGEVGFAMRGGDVQLKVDSPDGRFLVGRGGTTLRSIQYLANASLKSSGVQYRIDVLGGREEGRRDERPDDRPRRDYGDRSDRSDRPERATRDRGDRGGDRDRPRGPSRGGDRDRGADRERGGDRDRGAGRDRGGGDDRGPRKRTERELDELKKLAVRLARKVLETGESVEIRRELNSFERRQVHMAVAEIEGVATESVGDGNVKKIVIVPAGQGASASEE